MSERKQYILSKKWSRFFLVQALYEWQLNQSNISSIARHFSENALFEKANNEYFHELLQQITQNRNDLDAMITPYIDRELELIDPVERAILWLGCYELKFHPELPYKVVINEALELAKKFGAEGSHRYINSILDKVVKASKGA